MGEGKRWLINVQCNRERERGAREERGERRDKEREREKTQRERETETRERRERLPDEECSPPSYVRARSIYCYFPPLHIRRVMAPIDLWPSHSLSLSFPLSLSPLSFSIYLSNLLSFSPSLFASLSLLSRGSPIYNDGADAYLHPFIYIQVYILNISL